MLIYWDINKPKQFWYKHIHKDTRKYTRCDDLPQRSKLTQETLFIQCLKVEDILGRIVARILSILSHLSAKRVYSQTNFRYIFLISKFLTSRDLFWLQSIHGQLNKYPVTNKFDTIDSIDYSQLICPVSVLQTIYIISFDIYNISTSFHQKTGSAARH